MMSVPQIILWTIFVVLIVYIMKKLVKFYWKRYLMSNIPSPPGTIFLGNLPTFFKNSEAVFDILRDYANKYWPIYKLSTFYTTSIALLHPDDVEIALSTMKHTRKSRIYTLLENWLGQGLLTSYGQKWQTRRKILTPAFHFNILQQFLNVFNAETDKMVQILEQDCDKKYLNMVPYITQMTLQSIGETAMGLQNMNDSGHDSYTQSIHKMGKLLLNKITNPWFLIPAINRFSETGKQERETVKILHDFSNKVIREREKTFEYIENKDGDMVYSTKKKMAMLDLLLSAKKNGEIDYEGIREEVDTFMFEGHDTTAMAISFLMLCLENYKDVQEKVCQEIDDIIGLKSTKHPTYNDLNKLKYTERVIKETLRLYPSVPFISRYSSEGFTTKTGFFIPKGTVLYVHIFDLHRSPEIFPEPLKFDPDRFLPEICNQRHPFAYLPFSAGPRNCIGQKFAMLELKSVVCGVLRKFTLNAVDKPSDIKFSPDLVLRTKNEIRIKLTRK